MTFLEAKREFEIRLYLWAKSEWENEINESFPHLRLFRTGTAWETRQFMQQLDRSDQMTLSRGLIKRNCPDALKALGETCSTEEESLCSRRDDFFRIRGLSQHIRRLEKSGQKTEARYIFQRIRPAAINILGQTHFDDEECLASRLESVFRPIPATLEEEIAAREAAGEMIEFASKRKLKSALARKFKSVFGSQCIGPEYLVNEPDPQFQMRVCGWILSTVFFVGRQKGRFEYAHNISSEDTFEHRCPAKTYRQFLKMEQNLSFCSWLGITGATEWKYLVNEDVDAACDAAINFCGHFFEIAPKLLNGLELDKICEPVTG